MLYEDKIIETKYGGYGEVGYRARLWLWRPRVRIPVLTRLEVRFGKNRTYLHPAKGLAKRKNLWYDYPALKSAENSLAITKR